VQFPACVICEEGSGTDHGQIPREEPLRRVLHSLPSAATCGLKPITEDLCVNELLPSMYPQLRVKPALSKSAQLSGKYWWLSEDPLGANNYSCPILQPVGQSAVPGQGGSRNTCLGGSCRDHGARGGFNSTLLQGARHSGGWGWGTSLSPLASVQLCLSTLHTHAGGAGSPKNGVEGTQVAVPTFAPLLQDPAGPGSLRATRRLGLGGAALGWKKGVEQSGFVWCNPPELLPAPGGEGVWRGISRTPTHTRMHARRLLAHCPPWANSGTFTGEEFTACSHGCTGRHLGVPWGWLRATHHRATGHTSSWEDVGQG